MVAGSRSAVQPFERLAAPLQRALWRMGWKGLRDSQRAALPLILDTQDDVIISAATAAGKTEAAFLPLLTRLWNGGGDAGNAGNGEAGGVVLYVAPVTRVRHQIRSLACF